MIQFLKTTSFKRAEKMHSLSIFGTSSDAGKSTLSFALTYLLHQAGIKVAPFKAQNVSNNSHVSDDGGEIAIPQYFAAESIGLESSVLFNPILLKSGEGSKAHVIVNGQSVKDEDVWDYFKNIDTLKLHVKKAFKTLQKEYECVVAEGAGSPVELNLMDKDLSNIYIAKKFKTKIILVADIERGGVFASIYGVYKLLPKKLRKNIIGVIINKFQGDRSFFDTGVQIIEERFGLKVLGVVPYKPFNLGFEDSASLLNYTQKTDKAKIIVGVIKFPHLSNFTDFEPLVADEEVYLLFISNPTELLLCDIIVLPGSKRVVDDLAWLRARGFEAFLTQTDTMIIAICGGYEMLFESILDPLHVESKHSVVQGIGKLKGDVIFQKEKIVKKGCYNLFGTMTHGYEIHNATAKKRAKKRKNIYGTFIHGLFDNDALRYKLFSQVSPHYQGYNFQMYKSTKIEEFAQHVKSHIDLDYLLKSMNI